MQVRPLLENTIRTLDLGETPEDLAERVRCLPWGRRTSSQSLRRTATPRGRGTSRTRSPMSSWSWSREYRRESIKAAADEVEARLDVAKSEILELGRRIQDEGKSDELAAELAIATGNYTTLAAKLEELRINAQLEMGSGRVVSPAVVSRGAGGAKPAAQHGAGARGGPGVRARHGVPLRVSRQHDQDVG